MNDTEKAVIIGGVITAAAVGAYAYTQSIKAKTTTPELTITVSGNGQVEVEDNGIIIGTVTSSNTFPISAGDIVTLIATPASGEEFSGFTVS